MATQMAYIIETTLGKSLTESVSLGPVSFSTDTSLHTMNIRIK